MNAIKYKNIKWTHQIKLPNGEVTPGEWFPSVEEYGLNKINFKNKRVLDIGCLDGFYSFYAEQNGAKEVVSIDVNDLNERQFGKELNPDGYTHTGYLYAHDKLKSKAKYIFPYSVYDLDPKFLGTFDIVLFLGVFYHLAHPTLAFEKINEVMNYEGILIAEGQVSETFSQFYHKVKNTKKSSAALKTKEKEASINFDFISKMINYFNSLQLNYKWGMIKFFLITKTRFVLWYLLRPVINDSKEVFKNDISNFWIMDPRVLERILDFSGFKVDFVITNSLLNRKTYICKKRASIDKIYGHKVDYSNQKIISNLNIKNYSSLLS